MKEIHSSNKDYLIWDQCRHSKSIFLSFGPSRINLTLLFYIKIEIFDLEGNFGIFQNNVEAKPLNKKC